MCAQYGRFYCGEPNHEHQCHPKPTAGGISFDMRSFRVGSHFPVAGMWIFETDDRAIVTVKNGKVESIECDEADAPFKE